jgi:hypothetical protein
MLALNKRTKHRNPFREEAMSSQVASPVERSTARKVYWRLLPLAVLTYFLCYLDRINVGFAALTMNKDLGLDAATYGMAAGAFFWGYFLFEVPSNLILEKVGARIWIARIMVSWGLLSGATAFCTGPWSFLTMRFLLGLAEAGLFPGMILFFTYWFPEWHRARIMAGFTVALPLAVAVGAPLSTALLELNGTWGIAGWKWMFIAEAVPTILVGIFFLFFVTDRPIQAHWLSSEERNWLITTLEDERKLSEAQSELVAIVLGAEGSDPDLELFRHRHREPRLAAVPAADGETAWIYQHAGRLGQHDPVCVRRFEHGDLGLALRPHGRAALEFVLRLHRRRRRLGHRRHDDRKPLGRGRHDDCDDWALRHQGAVLDHAVHVLDRHRRRVGHRLDQRHR